MKLKPLIGAALISTLGLVGSAAIAATASHKEAAYDAPSHDFTSIVTGNSVMPHNGLVALGKTEHKAPASTKKGAAYDAPSDGVPFAAGMIANIDSYYSSESKYEGGVPFWPQIDKSYADVYVKNANLFLNSNMGVVHATINFGYNNSGASTYLGTSHEQNQISDFGLNEGYVNIYENDFSLPLYLRLGRFYQNFGHYDVYSMLPDLTQYMSQVNGAGAEVGYIHPMPNGAVYADISGFGGASTAASDFKDRHPGNFSAKVGVQTGLSAGSLADNVATDLDVSYLHQLSDLDYYNGTVGTGFTVNAFPQGAITTSGGDASYHGLTLFNSKGKALGAVDVHANMQAQGGSLDGTGLDLNFVTFLGKAHVNGGSKLNSGGTPWAVSVDATYKVNQVPVVQSASLLLGGGFTKHAGYNGTGATGSSTLDAVGLGLPEWQAHFGLGACITRNLSTQLVYQHNAEPKNTGAAIDNKTIKDSSKHIATKASNVVMWGFTVDV